MITNSKGSKPVVMFYNKDAGRLGIVTDIVYDGYLVTDIYYNEEFHVRKYELLKATPVQIAKYRVTGSLDLTKTV